MIFFVLFSYKGEGGRQAPLRVTRIKSHEPEVVCAVCSLVLEVKERGEIRSVQSGARARMGLKKKETCLSLFFQQLRVD